MSPLLNGDIFLPYIPTQNVAVTATFSIGIYRFFSLLIFLHELLAAVDRIHLYIGLTTKFVVV